jgi:hypothetical protein
MRIKFTSFFLTFQMDDAQKDSQESSEIIQITTSITSTIVLEDGSITPRAPGLITTGLFETGSTRQDFSTSSAQTPSLNSQLGVTGLGLSGTSVSQSTWPDPISSGQQQTQQSQQRRRELHYENANAVLVPPLNFAMVAPGVYRSGHPNKNNFPFMRKLGLKVIV